MELRRLAFVALISLIIGMLLGHVPLRRDLNRCQQQREVLYADLSRAVARGVLIETQLNLCKESK